MLQLRSIAVAVGLFMLPITYLAYPIYRGLQTIDHLEQKVDSFATQGSLDRHVVDVSQRARQVFPGQNT